MKKTIIAMGGGYLGEHKDTYHGHSAKMGEEFYENTTLPIDKMVVEATGKANPKILLITTATEDGKHNLKLYIEAFKKQYESFRATVNVLNLITEKPSEEDIESIVLSADAIYVSGGNSYLMLEEWRKLGVDKLLRQAFDKGTVMAGLSAGSICWFKYGNSNSFYTKRPFVVDGLGWINAFMCPHYDTEQYRQEPFKQMLKEKPGLVGIALDEHAAIEIVDDKYRIHIYKSGAKVRRCYWQDNEYIIEDIKADTGYLPLSRLLR